MDFPEFFEENGIHFFAEDVAMPLIDEDRIADWVRATAAAENTPVFEINYVFCSDDYLLKMNIEHLDHDYYTDIITFQLTDKAVHGDLFISTDRVADNADELGVSFEQELYRVMIHGILHMCGYGDKTVSEALLMREKEAFYLNLR